MASTALTVEEFDRLACSGGTLRITRHGTSNSERGAAPLTPPASLIPLMIDRAGYPPIQDGPVIWPPPVLSAPVEPGHCGRYGPGGSPRTGLHASCRSISRPSAASPRWPASDVEDAELPTLRTELNGILGWIEQLNEVNIDGIEPLAGAAQMALKMRDDVVTDGGYPEQVLANAPERAGDFFVVPKVVE